MAFVVILLQERNLKMISLNQKTIQNKRGQFSFLVKIVEAMIDRITHSMILEFIELSITITSNDNYNTCGILFENLLFFSFDEIKFNNNDIYLL